tara:strand:+ start:397 stop:810 length:414 start_codon:yes stop_codon:yes gene_type:complete
LSYYEIGPDQLAAMEKFAMTNNDPIVMVNLMKVREHAEYGPDSLADPCSGSEAMDRYRHGSAEVRKQSGAKIVWRGEPTLLPIAPKDEEWNSVVLVSYPNTAAYLKMRSTPEYQAARLHRQAGLDDSRLLMCIPDIE